MLARDVFGKKSRLCPDMPALVASLKRHPSTYRALHERLARVKPETATLPRLKKRLADAFTDRAFLGAVVDASNGELPRTAIEETVRHTMLELADRVEKELAHVTDRSESARATGVRSPKARRRPSRGRSTPRISRA